MKKPIGSTCQHEMLFEHYYARRIRKHRVVLIEYVNDMPHSVVTDECDGYCNFFDFETDCNDSEMFMFFYSGSGGKITEIAPSNYVSGSGASYWIHPEAKFIDNKEPVNCQKLANPIKYNGSPNPFDNGREVYAQNYCKICEQWYDEDYCPDHHLENADGEFVYTDGTPVND